MRRNVLTVLKEFKEHAREWGHPFRSCLFCKHRREGGGQGRTKLGSVSGKGSESWRRPPEGTGKGPGIWFLDALCLHER